MKRNPSQLLIGALLLASLAGAGCSTGKGVYSEEDLGLRKASIYDENRPLAIEANYTAPDPGSAQPQARSFENAPPVIPHSLEGLLPIEADNNSCLGCHSRDTAEEFGTLPTPLSHLYDMRARRELAGKLSQARYNCVQCHVSQADTPLVISNQFEPEFRDNANKERSNLLEILNEGVN